MSFGLQLINDFGRVQIDADFKAPRLIGSGTAYKDATFMLPHALTQETPMVMVQPHVADQYVGAVSLYVSGGSYVAIAGQGYFNWAVYSTLGAAISDGSQFGLEVYKADGSVAYSSRHRHPCLTHMFNKPADYGTGGGSGAWPSTYYFSGYTEVPWIFANPLLQTMAGVGEFSESVCGIMAKVNGGLNSITVDMRDMANPAYPTFPALDTRHEYNPYYQLPAWFAVGRTY